MLRRDLPFNVCSGKDLNLRSVGPAPLVFERTQREITRFGGCVEPLGDLAKGSLDLERIERAIPRLIDLSLRPFQRIPNRRIKHASFDGSFSKVG
jgi:hypothetical protein